MAKETLTIKDNRTEQEYEVPIWEDTIPAMELRQIKVNEGDFGMMSFDPGFKNTATTESTITLVDGANGILRYRGYPIDQLCEKSDSFESAYLIQYGELPTKEEYDKWVGDLKARASLPENFKAFFKAFEKDGHPMGKFIASVAALGPFNPTGSDIENVANRVEHVQRLFASAPTLAAYSYRNSQDLPYVEPDPELSYAGNFLKMMFADKDGNYELNPALEEALDILFILHMDHEQNCGTNAMRSIGSSHVDPYSAMAGAAAALYGPLHGGANEAVLRMLTKIGDVSNIPAFLEGVKAGKEKLMGFGHRVYKNYDPRARIIKSHADEVFKIAGANPLLDIALELEKIALNEDYFAKRKLYPNVDFYSGMIYQALGIPRAMFTVMFAIPRSIGWLAQWQELLNDPLQKIARPRQVYLGEGERSYKEIEQR